MTELLPPFEVRMIRQQSGNIHSEPRHLDQDKPTFLSHQYEQLECKEGLRLSPYTSLTYVL